MIRFKVSLNTYIILIIVILISANHIFPQNLDSLYHIFVKLRGYQADIKSTQHIHSISQHRKCGFGIVNTILQNFSSYSKEQQVVLSSLMERPALDTSIVSPRGWFRLHYDLTGSNRPAYFNDPDKSVKEIVQMSIDSLAAAFDKSYDFEVNYLGYNSPLNDGSLGGDNFYDIYVADIGYYGLTTPDVGQISSYIHIDNDFSGNGFHSKGIHGAKVTAAHELHHAIQLTLCSLDLSQVYFYEMTSAAMEEFVFDDINDYYHEYLVNFFNTPHLSLVGDQYRGYEDCIFFIYLYERFLQDENDGFKGYDIIKKSWENFAVSGNAISAIAESMSMHATSLKYELANFGIWCYFTGSRYLPGKYFEEAKYYPKIEPFASYQFNTSLKKYTINTHPVSNNYLIFELTDQGFHDTLVTILTNCDIEGTENPYIASDEIAYTLTTDNEKGTRNIVNNYYSGIQTAVVDFITESNIYNNEVVTGQKFERETLEYAYPQPFINNNDHELYIPASPNNLGFADLNIYTAGMNLIYSGKVQIIAGEKIVIKWNVRDNKGDKLPTGVYIYAVKSGNSLTKGKFVVYNE